MQARNIKVGQQYLARLDSSTERTQVMVVAKHRVNTQVHSACTNECRNVTITVFDVRNSEGAWTLTTGVQARDLFELPAPPERPEQHCVVCCCWHADDQSCPPEA